MLELLIEQDGAVYIPVVEGSITLDLDCGGTPGKLTFSVLSDRVLTILEGSRVSLKKDGEPLFYGYVFERKMSSDHVVSITAYDQLRYLKNKESRIDENVTAAELVRVIANQFKLTVGELEDTKYKMQSVVSENKTLLDIILGALKQTTVYTGQHYCLYDDFGKITLKHISNMKLDILVDQSTAENYDYTSSIDGDTYNQIKVCLKSEGQEWTEPVVSSDGEAIKQWGVLQYVKEIEKGEAPKSVADSLLKRYNQQTKKLTIKNAFGHSKVRAGSFFVVKLTLEGEETTRYMIVDKVKHTFQDALHTMDLTLKGGGFSV